MTRPLLAAVLAALLAPAVAAAAPLPQERGVVDLRTQANVQIVGARTGDVAGRSLAPAGDVNGDGVDDVVVGAPEASVAGRPSAGVAYVVFGRATKRGFRRQSMTGRGFRIVGPEPRAGLGWAVAGAGDVNGDGLDDLVLGAPFPPPLSDRAADPPGAAFVVFGKRDGKTLDLAVPGTALRVDGAPGELAFGAELAAGHDVDGDGVPDAVLGQGPSPRPVPDTAYVLRGGPGTGRLSATDLGGRGMALHGAAPGDVALVPDMTGDGRAEVAVGRRHIDGATPAVAARVVFGRSDPAPVDVTAAGPGGFDVRVPATPFPLPAPALSGGPDVNGDRRGDLVVGALSLGAHVVLGAPSTEPVELSAPGSRSWPITGLTGGLGGPSVALVGDVDGDLLGDVLAGDETVRARGRSAAGRAFVVFGRRGATSVDVRRLGRAGIRIDGARYLDQTGRVVASAGDFNGDGRADVLLAGDSARRTYDRLGSAYVVYGFGRARRSAGR